MIRKVGIDKGGGSVERKLFLPLRRHRLCQVGLFAGTCVEHLFLEI